MELWFKVGTHPARFYHVCRLKKAPSVGQTFEIVDKDSRGCKPFRVHLTEIKAHPIGTDLYFVERM